MGVILAVRTVCYREPGRDHDEANSFAKDLIQAGKDAQLANDLEASKRLRDLSFVYLYAQLPAKGANDLIDYLETRQVWHWDGERPVYKTVDEPCIAYTADINDDGTEVTVTALAACYRYPSNDDEKWWTDVVLPRVRRI